MSGYISCLQSSERLGQDSGLVKVCAVAGLTGPLAVRQRHSRHDRGVWLTFVQSKDKGHEYATYDQIYSVSPDDRIEGHREPSLIFSEGKDAPEVWVIVLGSMEGGQDFRSSTG